MRAATMHGVREPLTVTELPDPTLEPHGAIVRVEANGVCRSDWHGWVGDWDWVGVEFEYPHVLGHEFCGVVEEVGSEVRRFKAGDRDRYIITRVTYRLPRSRRPEIRYPELRRRLEADGVDVEGLPAGAPASTAVREAVLDLRRGKAMLLEAGPDARSAGSFFLNPVLTEDQLAEVRDRWSQRGGSAAEMPVFPAGDGLHKVAAAWLVERSGFSKGTRRGGAAISERHALALVNRGGTSSDLLALAGEVAAGVRETFGVRLEPEPVYVPPHGAPGGGSSQESG